LRSCLEEKVAAPIWEIENTAVGIRHAEHVTLYPQKVGANLADKQRSLTRAAEFSSLGIYFALKDTIRQSGTVCVSEALRSDERTFSKF
jgi:hypothetical protein